MKTHPVWIDCDPGIDDAAALLLAHRLPELEVLGISTVSGNVPLAQTTENALKLCDLMGAAYPVHRGAAQPLLRPYVPSDFHGADGLGGTILPPPRRAAQTLPAWDALSAAAERYAGELEVITLGPLTNLAIALGKDPLLAGRLRRVVMMGGSATHGNCTPCAEFNVYTDPEAAQTVFRSGVPIVMCGLEVTEQAYLTPAEIDAIGAAGSAAARFLSESCRHILQKNLDGGFGGWCVHDACPVVYLARPELFQGRQAGVFVETQAELTRGKTVTDLYSDKQFDRKNTLLLLSLDRAAFAHILQAVISGGAYGI